jgi:hypothetical protein
MSLAPDDALKLPLELRPRWKLAYLSTSPAASSCTVEGLAAALPASFGPSMSHQASERRATRYGCGATSS